MAIHVILEFDTREEAVESLGGVEARHIVEWFDDEELKNKMGGASPAEELESPLPITA